MKISIASHCYCKASWEKEGKSLKLGSMRCAKWISVLWIGIAKGKESTRRVTPVTTSLYLPQTPDVFRRYEKTHDTTIKSFYVLYRVNCSSGVSEWVCRKPGDTWPGRKQLLQVRRIINTLFSPTSLPTAPFHASIVYTMCIQQLLCR